MKNDINARRETWSGLIEGIDRLIFASYALSFFFEGGEVVDDETVPHPRIVKDSLFKENPVKQVPRVWFSKLQYLIRKFLVP